MSSLSNSIRFADIKFVGFSTRHLDHLDVLMSTNFIQELSVLYLKGKEQNFLITEPAVNNDIYEFVLSMIESREWLKGVPKLKPSIRLKFFYNSGLLVSNAYNVPIKD